jgi:hypothetical protein
MIFRAINDVGGPLGPVDDCSRDYPTLRGRGIVYIVRILNLANYSSLVTKIDILLLFSPSSDAILVCLFNSPSMRIDRLQL